MENTSKIQDSHKKIYKTKAIAVATFLGGPLVAGYCISENFKVFGEYKNAKKTWIYTVIATIFIFAGIFLIPDNFKIPNQIIPIIYTSITVALLYRFQNQNIENHTLSGGGIFGWWRIIGIAIISLSITIATLFSIILLTDTTSSTETVKTYGHMKHEIAFDNTNLTENEVNELANVLIATTFFDEELTKFIYAEKVNNTYVLSISVVDGIANDKNALQPYHELKTELQRFYPHYNIVLNLVVDNLDHVVKTIE